VNETATTLPCLLKRIVADGGGRGVDPAVGLRDLILARDDLDGSGRARNEARG